MTGAVSSRVVRLADLPALAGELCGLLGRGAVVALRGPLGAGKTTLVRHVAARLGVAEAEVKSPSFTLVNVYAGRSVTVYHVDLYRVRGEADLGSLDLEEFLYDPGVVTLIEWPEVILSRLPPTTLAVSLDFLTDGPSDGRSVEVGPLGSSRAAGKGMSA